MESLDRATATVQLGGKDDFGTQKMKGQPRKPGNPLKIPWVHIGSSLFHFTFHSDGQE